MLAEKFENRAPSDQTAIDVFKGRWASNIGEVLPGVVSGQNQLFETDIRPKQAAAMFGRRGRLDGMKILELGPLEGAHTYQLEKLGAEVTAVESNAEAYLKCLIVKEVLGLRKAKFLLGDCIGFLEENRQQWDLVFCSGILYHMSDPVNLIRLCAKASKNCFVWTHYFDPERFNVVRTAHQVERFGFETTYYEAVYPDRDQPVFWGGKDATACWLTRDDMLSAFKFFGFEPTVIAEDLAPPPGPCLTLGAKYAAKPVLKRIFGRK